jgi:hypothetical protein
MPCGNSGRSNLQVLAWLEIAAELQQNPSKLPDLFGAERLVTLT